MSFLYQTERVFDIIVQAGILFLNAIGVVVLLWAAIRCVVELFQGKEHARVNFAEGTALALSFKLGAEVLRTVVVREWSELASLGAIIALRAALAFLIQWEIKNERKNLAADAAEEAAEEAEEAGELADRPTD